MKENNNELKKSYNLFIVWLLAFFILQGIFSASLLGLSLSSKVKTLLHLNFTNVFIISLFVMIYKTERIYYINYVPYKLAQKATREERKNFAYRHLRVFCTAFIIFMIYSSVSMLFQYPSGLDIGMFAVILIVSALRTIPFKISSK